MRRMMAAEVAAAKARGETISENTSTSDDDDEDNDDAAAAAQDSNISEDDEDHHHVQAAANVVVQGLAANPGAVPPRMDESCLSDANSLFGGGGDDKGHEADMDDTSMSSRASSRMMGESMDSMSAAM